MLRHIVRLAVVIGLLVSVNAAVAGEFDGWCFPADRCVGNGEPLPVHSSEWGGGGCEQICSPTKPTPVRGMKALLYDVICEGEGETWTYRALILKYEKDQEERAQYVDQFRITELIRCKK